MKKFISFLTIVTILLGCDKAEITEAEKNPCDVLVNGVYQFPTEKPDPTLTKDEIKEYWDIPKEVLGCITTEGLIKSCYITMYGIFINASNGYQSGYQLLKGWCRGFDELERRPDAPKELLSYFKSIELPHTIDYNLFALEVAAAQDSILKRFSKEQKIEMLNLSLNYHAKRRAVFNRSDIIYDGTPVFIGRLLVFEKNEPFLQSMERNNELVKFIDGMVTYHLSLEKADTIIYYANIYLNELSEK